MTDIQPEDVYIAILDVKIWKYFPWARRVSAPSQPTVLPIIQQLKDTNCLYDTESSA